MESEISRLLINISTYKQTHPNISLFWEGFLTKKLKGIRNAINGCHRMLDSIDEVQDLSGAEIVCLYCIGEK
jgi:hypothetical protein